MPEAYRGAYHGFHSQLKCSCRTHKLLLVSLLVYHLYRASLGSEGATRFVGHQRRGLRDMQGRQVFQS